MLRKVASYIRQQHIALLALFVAMGGSAYAAATIDSSKVVDNSLTGADVKGRLGGAGKPFSQGSLTGADVRGSSAASGRAAVNGSLTGADVADKSLTGADIAQSSLSGLGMSVGTSRQATYQCDTPNVATECAPVTLNVPAGRKYRALVLSSFAAKTPTGAPAYTHLTYCPAVKSNTGVAETCLTPHHYSDNVLLAANVDESGSISGHTSTLGFDLGGPATWTFSTLLTLQDATGRLARATDLNAHTTVIVTDASAPAGPALGTIDCGGIGGQSSGTSSGDPGFPNDPCGGS
jgi:hypothetical protein